MIIVGVWKIQVHPLMKLTVKQSVCQLQVPPNLNIGEWKQRMEAFENEDMVKCLEFGWPLGFGSELTVYSV